MAGLYDCPICFELYTEEGERRPKWLPCSHTHCLKCLRDMQRNGGITCSQCTRFHIVPDRGPEVYSTNR